MKNFVKMVLIAVSFVLSAGSAFAVDVKVTTPDVKGAAKSTGENAKTSTKATATATKDDAKSAAKGKIVDINTATDAELKAVPGIGDAYAAKIIAGRPYANKTQLKSRKVLPGAVYEQVKDLLIAKQAKK